MSSVIKTFSASEILSISKSLITKKCQRGKNVDNPVLISTHYIHVLKRHTRTRMYIKC